MCQAIPRKVLQIDGERVEVLYDGRPEWVIWRGIEDLTVGEYLIVYAGQALEKMHVEEAEDILRFQEELEQMLEEASR